MVASWLNRKALLGWLRGSTEGDRSEERRSPPAEIECPCGFALTVERAPYRQIVSCPKCQTEHFVYPISPYPEPAPPRRRRKQEAGVGVRVSRKRDERGARHVVPAVHTALRNRSLVRIPSKEELPLVTELSSLGTPKRSEAARRAAAIGVTGASRSAATAALGQAGAGPEPVGLPDLEAAYPRRRVLTKRTLISLIVLFVLVMIGGVTFVSIRQARREAMRRELFEQWRVAQAALRDGDLAGAIAAFERVHRAVRTLGEGDVARSPVAHLTEEALALRDLVDAPPADIFDDLPTPEWPTLFETTLKGRAVLIEARLIREGGTIYLDFLSFADGNQVRWAVAPGSELDRVGEPPEHRVLLVGRLERVEAAGNGAYTAWLEPSSVRLISSEELLRAFGWPEDPATARTVDWQRDSLFGSESVGGNREQAG